MTMTMNFTPQGPPLHEELSLTPEGGPGETVLGRTYLSESGWRIGVKVGNSREFCHMKAPGQDFYHRLLDQEIYLQRDTERICLACASRRGLLAPEPRRLREAGVPLALDVDAAPFDTAAREAPDQGR